MADLTTGLGPRSRSAVTVGVVMAAALAVLTSCSGGSAGTGTRVPTPARVSLDAPAPTPDRIVRDAVRTALKASTAQFTFTVRSTRPGTGTRANGSGTVDLARGRLDQVQKVTVQRAGAGTDGWQSRYLLVGDQAYVKNLTGPKKGFWWRGPVNQEGTTYTRDGYADPMEFLRLLLTLDAGVTAVGDRVIQGDDVVAYNGTARPSKSIAASYRRPGRAPGQLAGNLRYLGIGAVTVRVYLDGKGLPMRIVLSGKGKAGGGRSTVAATLTTVGWGTPGPIRRPTFEVPTFDQLYS